ncbi:choline transporter-like protein 1 isoform X1 [Salvelinus namaycush]|uniref:Choline transporter-like protein n=1 Tax=Salvelinus namaycush TaxID=8040 RepID=A0A8U0R6J4_SALNM|nr:choline transporter-like protein 1 isoform X1 [Salvelinus namaycush]
MGCCGSSEQKQREWKPLEDRSCTDIPWLIIFTLFCIGMACIAGFSISTGAASRLISGYDSYGNTCGQKNGKIEGVELSGRDQTNNKYVFFLDPCNIDILNRKIKSMALCVSRCPDIELKTYTDVKKFALQNGSELCSYDIPVSKYPSHGERSKKCPKLPVPPRYSLFLPVSSHTSETMLLIPFPYPLPLCSNSLPVFHRCTPVDISCYAQFAEAFVTFVSDNSMLHRVIAGVMASKEIIMGLCVLALVLSIILMVVIRYISVVLVWILTALVVLGSIGGTGVLWWLYVDHRTNLTDQTGTSPTPQQQVATDNVQALLVYAIFATVFTVILLLLLFFMRKRVALTITLFHVAGKVFTHLPLLALQPFWTFLSLMLFWVSWLGVLLFLGTAGSPVQSEEAGLVEYRISGPLQYMVWYHAVGLIWISQFILACQQMTVAGAVVTYYFTRNKSELPMTPIVSSMLCLTRYHLGTVAKGSFIITLVEIPRLILTYIHNQLKGKENACARCMLKSCICCLWCLKKCLMYLNQNAYTATAINSTSFCTSARDAFVILVENVLRVATINTVGDFVLFLGKVLIVSCTAFVGVLSLNYQRDYTVWVLPLLIVCLFSWLVAHCFLSVFEIVVDVLFLCFAVDTKHNDGSPGREFYMDKALMEFVENSKNMAGRDQPEADGDGREMKPMTHAGGTFA